MKNKRISVENCKHPDSRKTKALTKHLKKVSSKQKAKLTQAVKQNVIGEKITWFKEHLEVGCVACTPEQVDELINLYINRFQDELEQIQLKHSIGMRKNRQHASREDIIKMTVQREREEYETCGLEIPDLLNPQQVAALLNWNGELRFLQNIKCKRFARKMLK